ncbi:hypothetical protein J1N35_037406, partial [Gossypium stocksii]
STKSQIISKGDGTIEVKFDHSHLHGPKGPSIFPTQLMMQPKRNPTIGHDNENPKCCCDLCKPGPERNLFNKPNLDGNESMFKVSSTGMYEVHTTIEGKNNDEVGAWIDSMYHSASKLGKRKNKKISTLLEFYKKWMEGDPNIGPLGEDNGKYVYLVDYSAKVPPP